MKEKSQRVPLAFSFWQTAKLIGLGNLCLKL